ncbi:MAG: hypothetical protein SGJ27_07740 [Candidatus Melainabacteria bacterium]|nr:hypothetical protein [Candidatus Melainabacteria bacterium]
MSKDNLLESRDGNFGSYKLVSCFVVLALCIAFIQIVAWRDYVGWDAVQYLEIADQILAGNWNELFRSYWSPLFPLLLALVKAFAGKGFDELVILNWVTYFSYVFTTIAFVFFARNLFDVQKQLLKNEPKEFLSLSPTQLTIGVYISFLYSTLAATELSWKTPDILGSGICLLTLAQCLALLAGRSTLPTCVSTGFFMALCCWAKNLHIGFVLILSAMLVIERKRNNLSWQKLGILLGTFAICLGALIVPLSAQTGRFTYSDVTHIGRSWCQSFGYVEIVHARSETFKHPTRILVDQPRFYEFATPFDVTYPPFYAPQYWYDGVEYQYQFVPKTYFPVLFSKLQKIFWVLFGVMMFVTAACAITARGSPFSGERLLKYSTAWVPAFAAISACIILADYQGRYFTSPLIALLCFYLACLRVPDTMSARRGLNASFAILMIWLSGSLFAKTFIHFYFACPSFAHAFMDMAKTKGPPSPPESPHLTMIGGLRNAGLKPGDRVARIVRLGAGDAEIYWAKAAGLKIVSESIDVEGFWKCDAAKRQLAYEKLKELGVKAIVQDWASGFPDYPVPSDPGWTILPGTKSYIYMLD